MFATEPELPKRRAGSSDGTELSTLELSHSEGASQEDQEPLEEIAALKDVPKHEQFLGPRKKVYAVEEKMFKEEFFGDHSPLSDRPFKDLWPNFPHFHLRETDVEKFMAVTVKSGLPTPKNSEALPVGIRRVKEDNGVS